MKTAELYAQTLYKSYQENPSGFNTFFDNFIELLKHKNHYKMLPNILSKVLVLAQLDDNNPTVLVVRESSLVPTLEKELTAYKDIFGTDYVIREEPNITGGFILKNRTSMVDQSYRTKLLHLYQQLVA